MVTSRETLNLQGEWVRQVGGLSWPQGTSSLNEKTYSAVEMFAACAQRLRGDFSLAEEMAHVVRICQLVDGMPLGIELAAGWTTVLTCAEIAGEIERDLEFMSTSSRSISDRHRSMQAVFDHSWHLLTDEERATMSRFSVFRGGGGREAAAQVTGTGLNGLSDLVAKSMLRFDPDSGHYNVQELLRQYAHEQLVASGDSNSAREAHCQYYATFMQQRAQAVKGHGQLRALDDIEADWNNIRLHGLGTGKASLGSSG